MNRSESKYFATAEKMDKAFLELLGRKEFSYITVKELCALAGVNRSTFYLHYETIGDLLAESVRYINEQFLHYMNKDKEGFVAKLKSCPTNELYLITPEYLVPYLSYIKEHKRLFRTAIENAAVLELEKSYERMFRHVFAPILERYHVPEQDRTYMMTFYIHGLMAILAQWLRTDCADSIEYMMEMIQKCVMHHQEEV